MKRTKLRRRSKNPAEVLRQKCVTKAKRIVREQHHFTCEYCGQSEPKVKTHGAHIYSEGIYRAMSADLDNILCLCFTNHLGSWNAKAPSWHNNPMEMTEWFRTKYPARAKELKARTRLSQQADLQFWEKKWAELSPLAPAERKE